jgi:hypothetical protein
VAKRDNKKPKPGLAPSAGKTPHAAAVPRPDDDRPVWRVGRVDLDGSWGWHGLATSAIEPVLGKLQDCESMTVGELYKRSGNKPIPIDSICKAARDRLQEIEADDLDELWELRTQRQGAGLGRSDRVHLLPAVVGPRAHRLPVAAPAHLTGESAAAEGEPEAPSHFASAITRQARSPR